MILFSSKHTHLIKRLLLHCTLSSSVYRFQLWYKKWLHRNIEMSEMSKCPKCRNVDLSLSSHAHTRRTVTATFYLESFLDIRTTSTTQVRYEIRASITLDVVLFSHFPSDEGTRAESKWCQCEETVKQTISTG
jgi:hypothetical protein